MPEYIYRCVCKNEITVIEPMVIDQKDRPTCPICGLMMWRKPQNVSVNWNGLAPSQGELAPALREHVLDADRRRDEVDEKYYERDKNRTA